MSKGEREERERAKYMREREMNRPSRKSQSVFFPSSTAHVSPMSPHCEKRVRGRESGGTRGGREEQVRLGGGAKVADAPLRPT